MDRDKARIWEKHKIYSTITWHAVKINNLNTDVLTVVFKKLQCKFSGFSLVRTLSSYVSLVEGDQIYTKNEYRTHSIQSPKFEFCYRKKVAIWRDLNNKFPKFRNSYFYIEKWTI